jgi:amidase
VTDIAFRSVTELAAAIHSREVSSRELLEHYLGRIERLNPKVNAVVTLDAERALAQAAAADEALTHGDAIRPLHGLPMTVKDSIETEGIRTTSGAPELADHVPAVDADAVARLKAAGAIVFGKTNLPKYAMDFQSFNDVHGTTGNPWDPERTPGGSSGGAAAALAAGLTGFELGSDIGGSIRNPAHFCGVYGLKPSYGIVPTRGHIPGPPGTLAPADVAMLGPLGRSAGDLGLGLDVIAGPDAHQETAWRLEVPPPRHATLADYRMAAWLDDPANPVDGEVREVLEDAVEALRHEGLKVAGREAMPVPFKEAAKLFKRLVGAAVSPGVPSEVMVMARQAAETAEADDEPHILRDYRAIAQFHSDWLLSNEERHRQRAAWAGFFREHDVVLAATMPVAAFPHDHSDDSMMTRTLVVNGEDQPYATATDWCGIFGVVYLPAAVVPVGRTRSGLPVGLQVVGPYLEDRTVVDVAARIADVVGGFEAPPGF